MPSRRSLRPDPEFDAIIANVYPDITVYDQFSAEMLDRIMSTSNTQALSASVEEGMRRQKSRGRGLSGQATDDATRLGSGDGDGAAVVAVTAAAATAAASAPSGSPSSMELGLAPAPVLASLKLVLERSPDEAELPVLQSRYLSVPRSTTAL